MGKAPRRRGGRLLLRAMGPEDVEQLKDAVEISRETLRRRLGADHAIFNEGTFVACFAEAATRGEAVAWGVFETLGGLLAGVSSLKGLTGSAEIEGWVRADRQGRGYGTEAARAAVERAFRRLGLHRVQARIDPANRAARKVLRRAGFRYEGRLRAEKRLNGRWVDQECWAVLRDEWKR